MKCTSRFVRASLPTCLALAFVVIHPAAQAESRQEKKNLVGSVSVSYADLDLEQPADAEILVGRIKKAAYQVCGGEPWRHTNYYMMPGRVERAFKECRADAVARAIAAVESAT